MELVIGLFQDGHRLNHRYGLANEQATVVSRMVVSAQIRDYISDITATIGDSWIPSGPPPRLPRGRLHGLPKLPRTHGSPASNTAALRTEDLDLDLLLLFLPGHSWT